jgi:7,8-dihydropterin-6-yl-methyl-4-(beta-D-ribofuranosyl)aminobenzene 5'-phosphate synthase
MIKLYTIVDNTVQRGSALWGEHGVSFAIETPDGRILFDTGQSGEVLLHNAKLVEIPLNRFDGLAISHAHYDHTGGIERFLSFAKPGIPLFANPGLFQERFSIKADKPESIGLRLLKDQLSKCVELRLSAEPTEILPGVWTTGEITDRSEFEGRSPNHFVRENGEWLPDPYKDDLSMVLDARDGLVVVCGCCHAGLLNTLAQIRNIFHKRIQAVIGGMHLASASPEALIHAVDVLRSYSSEGIMSLYPNHCTGERAYLVLAQAIGSKVQPCPAGTRLSFV